MQLSVRTCSTAVTRLKRVVGSRAEVEERYESDLAEGRWTHYWRNGRKRAEGMMHQGNPVGAWTFNAPIGDITTLCEFDAGGELVRKTGLLPCGM